MKAMGFVCSNGHQFYDYSRPTSCPHVIDDQPCEGKVLQVSGPGAKAKAAKS